MNTIYDVAIIGAGPGGSAAAHYLASSGLRVLLLDKFTFPRDKTCGDALTPRALSILADMDLLEAVQQIGYRLSKIAFVAPKGYSAVASLPARTSGPNYLLFAPRLALDHLIVQRAIASGADFQAPIRVTDVHQEHDQVLISGDQHGQKRSFQARMVILAVGVSTNLPLQMGILKKRPPLVLCARTYYSGLQEPLEAAHCRFDGVPLPGYGWVFPLPDNAANVGVGLFRSGLAARRMPKTAQMAFDTFIHTPPLKRLLAGATRSGPLKGYPLRVDFARAQTYAERTLLVGEAAGLVNPVTGEGIDYALESGKLAAQHLIRLFSIGDFSLSQLANYDKLLREHYQRLFVICDRLRTFYLNPFVINQTLRAADRNKNLMDLYMNIAIDNQDIYAGLSPKTLTRVLLDGLPRRSPTP